MTQTKSLCIRLQEDARLFQCSVHPPASLMESASDRKKRALEQLHATYGAPSAKVAKTNAVSEAGSITTPSQHCLQHGVLQMERMRYQITCAMGASNLPSRFGQ